MRVRAQTHPERVAQAWDVSFVLAQNRNESPFRRLERAEGYERQEKRRKEK